MAFTTASVDTVDRGSQQFQGLFKEMWAVTITADVPSIAAGAEALDTFTIPGVAYGDLVIAGGVTEADDAITKVGIRTDGDLVIVVTNVHASSALDPASRTFKILVARPSW